MLAQLLLRGRARGAHCFGLAAAAGGDVGTLGPRPRHRYGRSPAWSSLGLSRAGEGVVAMSAKSRRKRLQDRKKSFPLFECKGAGTEPHPLRR